MYRLVKYVVECLIIMYYCRFKSGFLHFQLIRFTAVIFPDEFSAPFRKKTFLAIYWREEVIKVRDYICRTEISELTLKDLGYLSLEQCATQPLYLRADLSSEVLNVKHQISQDSHWDLITDLSVTSNNLSDQKVHPYPFAASSLLSLPTVLSLKWGKVVLCRNLV